MAKKDDAVPKASGALSCGLVMPISALDSCSADHWAEVKSIVIEAVEGIADPKFSVKLVSDADDVGVIQKRIVQNIYSSDIIVCDVSGKNPNVMFELGMRLAFDKPTVIIKDDKTDYSFDTGIIEHVPYPRDLRFARIVTFKASLADKVLATHRAAVKNPDHSTFLKNFGKFQVANLTEDVIPADKLVLEMLGELQSEMAHMRRTLPREVTRRARGSGSSEAVARIAAAVQAYRRDKPDFHPGALVGNEDLYDAIERIIEAPQYFSGRMEFREAVDQFLAELQRATERAS